MKTIELSEIERAILDRLAKTTSQLIGHAKNKKWTTQFKNALHDLAEMQSPPCTCVSSKRLREFLWDIVWIEPKDASEKELWTLRLACEIEWNGNNEALYDFHKLIFSTAELCVMIFDTEWDPHSHEDRFQVKLEEMLLLLPKKDSDKRYFFLGVKSNLDTRPVAEIPLIRHHVVGKLIEPA